MDVELAKISPYTNNQVTEALRWLETQNEFVKGVQFFHPNWTENEIISKLKACHSCADFQVEFIEMIIKDSIRNSMSSFEIEGLENIDTSNCLFISNHRDIFLDSALLQNHLYDLGKTFTEISLGDNLMVNSTMKAVAKLNNMFTVFRSKNKSEMLKNSINLSKYLRYSIVEKKVSSWIAQGNGRTKDGDDKTAPGLIKMLLLSGGADIKQSMKELNIVVSTISFEYEPCAFEKANEMSLLDKTGVYNKSKFENLNSIVKGIKEYKGKVKLVFEKLNLENINFLNNKKKDAIAIALEIDRIVYRNYQLNKTNYMAYDLLYNDKKYDRHYSVNELENFKKYMFKAVNEDVNYRLITMYAKPIANKEALIQKLLN
ncbi:MAG: hypothetical protein JKY08_04630 [Flavobacteriaceae bacterium]|nr:hypothetical protein [Flavobacteriaceae bacterium]